jgi:AraC-like DNA-binding protein
MITPYAVASYRGKTLSRGEDFLYIPPHALLRPFISNYTVSFPTPRSMPDAYAILPTASSTLVISVGADQITAGLRGVNTRVCTVGSFANRMTLLLLIEFRPGGLYPFFRLEQTALTDASFPLYSLDSTLERELEDALIKTERIEALIETLDRMFLTRLSGCETNGFIPVILQKIMAHHGNVGARELSSEFYYSEKQIRRLFLRHVGTGPKTFSRIVRVNYALRLLQHQPRSLADVAAKAGYFDESHLIRDFKTICGLSIPDYRQNMSVFYNDRSKM